MLRLCLAVVLACFLARCDSSGCDPATGPPAGTKCSIQPPSTEYQWSVCLNDDYLQLLTNGADQCTNGAAFCWRPCSLEDRKASCACSPQATVPPSPPLPDSCYSPPGKTCNWYRECLNVKQPCGDSKYDYALSFGERFCKAYDKTYHMFSSKAKEWIDAVRRCLQVELVYVLRPWESLTCEEIRSRAFASHTGCYLSPAPGAPSICDLGLLDWWRIFWTIKGAIVSETYEVVKGFLDTALKGCLSRVIAEVPPDDTRRYSATVKLGIALTSTSVIDNADKAGEVTDSIAQELKWDSSALDWFAYVDDAETSRSDVDPRQMIVLLGNKAALGLAGPIHISPHINLEGIVTELASAVESGDLDDIIKICSMSACSDLRCADRYVHMDMTNGYDRSGGMKNLVALLAGVLPLFSLLLN